jgi:F-type H+-transporting ATPase subunit delta
VAPDATGAVYGEALFEAASDAGAGARVQEDLAALGGALGSSRELVRVLVNPAFPDAGKKRILAGLAREAHPLTQNALQLLVDRGRISSLPDVIDAYGDRFGAAERHLEVELTTAIAIDDEQAEGLRARLAESTGRGVSLTRRVDPAILGGIVLRVRDLLIDASVRGRLEKLRLSLRATRLESGG